ncbi:P1 family peptidase [Micromonospora halotolerans]|uniref:P1 family peptidase n=1 Tax=Micromonospora halotolerans TaxID=709879 RepID=A0ABY9ZVF4_9ACTN|nr:P1 family peptidase [Micromonospora halotolerans]WNM38995.1 P1 family peptidase [Micromonospora halotolerans]
MASMASRSAALLAGALMFSVATVGVSGPAVAAGTPGLPGRYNAISDVPGIQVGQVQSTRAPYLTGSTVVYTPRMSVTGVDQEGGAPATKETDLLDPLNSNPGVNAVMLGGSSMYGLSAADGVIRWLEERGEGVRVGNGVAPIVPAADIFDLGRGGNFRARTTPAWGWLAAENANPGAVAQGVVGGGTGARSGGLKGGVGTASMVLDNGIVVGAIVVVNSVGSPVDPRDCSLLAARYEVAGEFRGLETPKKQECNPPGAKADEPSMNTTIAVVATNAPLEKAAAARMATNAHDGLARAINPIHTLSDGDTVFAVSTGDGTPLRVNADGGQLNGIFNAAADTLTRAVGHAILNATTVGTAKSYCDRYPSACKKLAPLPADKRGTAPEVTAESLSAATGKVSGGTPPVGGSSATGQAAQSGAPAAEENKTDESRQPASFTSAAPPGGDDPSPLLLNGGLALVGLGGLAGATLIRRRAATRS